MAMKDYKIARTVTEGKETAVLARFYEGDITTENEFDVKTDKVGPVTRYRRTALLKTESPTYTDKDDIRAELNAELAKDGTRTAILEQA